MLEPAAALRALSAQLSAAPVGVRLRCAARLEQAANRAAEGLAIDRTVDECRRDIEAGCAWVAKRRDTPLSITYPEALPVSARRDEIVALLGHCNTFVLTGETGSGKTTQLPKMLLEAGFGVRGMIAMTQPRRVAAVAMARRIREELAAPDKAVAHSVRFDDQSDDTTLIRIMTDGLLLAEAAADPLLSRYDAIIVDEAHERSLNIDLLLALLIRLRARRPDLAIVVSSASIEAERFAAYLTDNRSAFGVRRSALLHDESTAPQPTLASSDSTDDVASSPTNSERRTPNAERLSDAVPCPVIAVSGRTFPVDIRHREPGDDDIGYLDAAVTAMREVHWELGAERGDVLCFLPTERDILEARRRLADMAGCAVLPLFGRLTSHEQQKVFQPSPLRKIVLATNVAETSLTIPGIRVVIDTGLARIKRYHAGSRTERLPVEAVSQASLTQRAGRAGRVEAGICIRLFAAEDAAKRDPFTTPEILRSNLAGVLLTCLHLGLGDPEQMPWLDAPTPQAWRQARMLLDELGAFAPTDSRSAFGVRRSAFPTNESTAPQPTLASSASTETAAPSSTNAERRTPNAERLSPLGRRLAALPADPQVARILLAGVDEGVPHEAATIAAFLSVQDPRVRPPGQEAKADAAHRAFAHEAGDIASVLRLWDAWQAAESNSAKARLCEARYLGLRRMREWADVRHQLWSSLRDGGRGQRGAPALPIHGHASEEWQLDRVHRAVLAGMLGNVLMYEREERAYRGAGGRLLHVHPGSALRAGKTDDSKKAPPPAPWLVACEVAETSRLFARMCAPIDPLWVLDLAGDRVKRSHRDAHWHPRRRQVVCHETVTWKGLPVREGRLVPYERIDPVDAERIFIQAALCDEDGLDVPVLKANRRILAAARRLRHRLRDPAVFVDESQMEAFYASKFENSRSAFGIRRSALLHNESTAPQPTLVSSDSTDTAANSPTNAERRTPNAERLSSADAFRRWLSTHGADRLALKAEDLVPPDLVARADRDFPEVLRMGELTLNLDYRYAPGESVDGATLDLDENDVAKLDLSLLDCPVTGWLPDIVTAALEQLPKDLRRQLIPLADSARELAATIAAVIRSTPLTSALRTALAERLRLPPKQIPDLRLAGLPDWLRLRYRLRDAHGTLVYEGRDPAFIATQAAASGDRLLPLLNEWATAPSAAWPGDCPGETTRHGVTGFVALARARDERGLPAAQRTVYASAASAAAWHDDGLDALLEATLAPELERLATAPGPLVLGSRCERALGQRLGAARRALALCVLRGVERKRVRDAAAWDDLRTRASAILAATVKEFDPLLDRLSTRADTLKSRLKQGSKSIAAAAAQRAALRHVDRLVGPGWTTRLPWAGMKRSDTYLDGISKLLDTATSAKAADAARASARRDSLMDLWDSVIDDRHRRLVEALGLGGTVRELAMRLEECLLTADGATVGTGAGFAERQLRDGLGDLSTHLEKATNRIAEGRDRLLHLHALTARLAPGRSRDQLQTDTTRLTRDFPDLGLGCDLDAQLIAIEALEGRVKTALR